MREGKKNDDDGIVWPPRNKKKFETLSYLREIALGSRLSSQQEMGSLPVWILKSRTLSSTVRTTGLQEYYDGRYWTMWKLPHVRLHVQRQPKSSGSWRKPTKLLPRLSVHQFSYSSMSLLIIPPLWELYYS
ncbi:Ribulose bisphosphate carboxylase, small chain [Parasponia andersonii]|uniref:Ribulose bisphosphate carboxylase, small chain n=1 Tax=Parasponia andersonii TaxID=3476 RepID=A0A2P5DZ93_PARAD|nr:Ribulose bisphosphate carboxylase, small chain [Parasponia andersonii]